MPLISTGAGPGSTRRAPPSAVLLAGALWFGLAWSAGPDDDGLGVVPPSACSPCVKGRPRTRCDFVWGVGAAALLGLFYLLWVLPQITGFPLLALWLAPPLAFGSGGGDDARRA